MDRPIVYQKLARRLSALPLWATCADLAASLRAYPDCEAGLRECLLAAVGELPPETEWLQGLFKICDVLQEQNPRFIPALFMEWVTDDY